MRRVVDASALVDAVLPSTRRDAALTALSQHELWAPSIIDLEVLSALWRLVRTSQIDAAEAERGRMLLQHAPLHRVDAASVAAEAWRLRESLRIGDAFYVAAALLLDADLVTSDARLSRAPSLGVTIVLLG